MNQDSKIFVTGHRGLVGSAVVRQLRLLGFANVMTVGATGEMNPVGVEDGGRFDFRNPAATRWLFSAHKPEFVFHCAAKVGGIKGNAENQSAFMADNLTIQNNVLLSAADEGVEKLVFLGSSCIYPRDCKQPIREDYLLSGPLEMTNEGYAIAKIAGVKLCQFLQRERGCRFVSAMPCNLFGINDKFDAHGGHVIPGMMARMHAAKVAGDKVFHVWGSPTTRRELMFSDDLAFRLIQVMQSYEGPEPINCGSGHEFSMAEIAQSIRDVVGFTGAVTFDSAQPSGTPRKLLDNSRIDALASFTPTAFSRALKRTYEHFLTTLK